jgi:hypothetical protein
MEGSDVLTDSISSLVGETGNLVEQEKTKPYTLTRTLVSRRRLNPTP